MEYSKKSKMLIGDEKYMRLALGLAKMGAGRTNPNPMVGAVIVKNGKIIGRGYHEKYGELHAERNALADCILAKESPDGATMYVTLEPCCHYGKTPPCTEAIIENKLARVVVGTEDPNTLVGGKGIALLEQAGIQVTVGVLDKECQNLNGVFFKYVNEKTPFVAMKYAMTADGKIATCTGQSKWITGDRAREHVHMLRHRYTGIMIGIGTLIADNPWLTCRLPRGESRLLDFEGEIYQSLEYQNFKTPIRIVCDTNLRIPEDCNIVETANEIKTYIATAATNDEKIKRLTEKGCKIIQAPKLGEHIDLKLLMDILGEKGIDSILLEGGGALNFGALQSGIVDYAYVYIAPKIFGGANALTPVEGGGVETPMNAYGLEMKRTEILGEDILIEYQYCKTTAGR